MSRSLPFLLFLTPALFGQLIVNDPANTAVSAAIQSAQASSHVEVMRQWATQLDVLNRQLRQIEQQLAEQRRVREVLGDPSLGRDAGCPRPPGVSRFGALLW
jgi:hypothetical protein